MANIRCKFFDDNGKSVSTRRDGQCPARNCRFAHPDDPSWSRAERRDLACGVRCKFYDDDGHPIDGGCRSRSSGCPFVHPGETRWPSAKRDSFAESSHSYRSKGVQPPPEDDPKLRRLAEQRKAIQSTALPATPDFEPSTWGKPAYLAASPINPEPVATTSGRKIPHPSYRDNAATSSKGKAAASKDSSASMGWGGGSWGSSWDDNWGGGGESAGGQKSGWGGSPARNEDSGWGAASPAQNDQPTWGAASPPRENSGWGAPSPPPGAQPAWGAPSPPRTEQQGWGWGASSPPRAASTTTQAAARTSGASSSSLPASSATISTTFQAASPSGSSNSQARNPSWGSVPVTPVEGSFRVPSRKPSLALTASEKTMDPRRKAAPPTTPGESTPFQPPLPTRKGKEVDRSIHRLPSASLHCQESEGRSSSAKPTAVPSNSAAQSSTKDSSKSQVSSRITRGSLKTSEERRHVYRSIVKELITVISLTIESEREQRQMLQWKPHRRDAHYKGLSKEKVDALDAIYAQWIEKCTALDQKKRMHMAKLLSYPNLPTQPKVYDIEGDWKKIQEYTKKLAQWMKELNLGQRLKPPQFGPEHSEGVQEDQVMGGPEEEWTMERLSEKLDEMTASAEEIDAAIPIDLWSDISQFDSKFKAFLQESRQRQVAKREKKIGEVLERQGGELVAFGENLKAKTSEASSTQEKMKAMEDLVIQLREQTEELNKANEKDEERIAKIEASQKARRAAIDSLRQQVRDFAASKDPASRRPRKEIDLGALAAPIREKLVNDMKKEIIPVMEAFVQSTSQSARMLQKEVDKVIDPLVEKTNRIIELAKERETKAPSSLATYTIPAP